MKKEQLIKALQDKDVEYLLIGIVATKGKIINNEQDYLSNSFRMVNIRKEVVKVLLPQLKRQFEDMINRIER